MWSSPENVIEQLTCTLVTVSLFGLSNHHPLLNRVSLVPLLQQWHTANTILLNLIHQLVMSSQITPHLPHPVIPITTTKTTTGRPNPLIPITPKFYLILTITMK